MDVPTNFRFSMVIHIRAPSIIPHLPAPAGGSRPESAVSTKAIRDIFPVATLPAPIRHLAQRAADRPRLAQSFHAYLSLPTTRGTVKGGWAIRCFWYIGPVGFCFSVWIGLVGNFREFISLIFGLLIVVLCNTVASVAGVWFTARDEDRFRMSVDKVRDEAGAGVGERRAEHGGRGEQSEEKEELCDVTSHLVDAVLVQ
jgi:hypothetical protein